MGLFGSPTAVIDALPDSDFKLGRAVSVVGSKGRTIICFRVKKDTFRAPSGTALRFEANRPRATLSSGLKVSLSFKLL